MNAKDDRLTGARHELTIFCKQVHAPMGKTIVDPVNANVAQHPIRLDHAADPDRIVQTVTTRISADRIADGRRHKVRHHRQ